MCINVANLGRKPYIPLHAFIAEQAIQLGFLIRGEIIWNKAASASPSTAWGSWKSASNPTLRDVHEYILVFCKDTFKRQNPSSGKAPSHREEFLEYNKSVWNFAAEPARKVGHPAPFPIELPRRLITLHLRRRGRARPVHGLRPDGHRRIEERAALRRLRDRAEFSRSGKRANSEREGIMKINTRCAMR